MRRFFEGYFRWRWPVGLGMAVALGAAAGVAVPAVRSARVADWYMHLGMWALLGVYLFLGLKAWYLRRRIRTVALFTLLELLSVFWGTVLVGKVPAETILVGSQVEQRADLPILFLPAGLLALLVLALLAGTISAFYTGERTPS
jgi:hypothetical protein